MIDYDEMAMEAHLFPWLDDDCMADSTTEEDFFDELNEFEDMEDFE